MQREFNYYGATPLTLQTKKEVRAWSASIKLVGIPFYPHRKGRLRNDAT